VRETVYKAEPELANPRAFIASAWADLAASPPIAWQLFRANLRASRRRSLLGHFWLLIPAAATTLLCVYLNARRIVSVGPTDLPYALHVLAGIVLWQTFVEAMNAPLQQLQRARQMISRSRLQHEAVIVAGLLEVALNATVRLVALGFALVAFGLVPAAGAALLFPLAMIATAVMGAAIGSLAAPFGLLYDDVAKGLTLLTSFWFFLTPILYPAPTTGWLRLNPVTPLIEQARSSLLAPALDPAFLVTAVAAGLGLLLAWLIYRLARPHVVERLG